MPERATADRTGRRRMGAVAAASLGSLVASAAGAQVLTTFTLAAPDASVGSFSLSNGVFSGQVLSNPSALTTGAFTYGFTSQLFTPGVTGEYRIGQSSAPLDTALILYAGSFDPNSPGTNAIVGNDDGAHPPEANVTSCGSPTFCPSVLTELQAGADYVVVVTHYSPDDIASFTLPQSFYVFGPAGVGVGGEPPPAPPGPGIIDDSEDAFDQDSAAATGDTVTFGGGRFRPTEPFTLSTPVQVQAAGGTVDTDNGNVTFGDDVTGDGQLTVEGTGDFVITGNATNAGGFSVAGGRMLVQGVVGGPIQVGAGGTLGGTGTIQGQVDVDGTLSPGASPGTLTVNAPVVQGPGSTFLLEIDGTGTGDGPGNFDRLLVTGAGNTFTADGTLQPITRGITPPADNTFTPSLGQTFRFVEAEGGVVGTFAAIDQPADGIPAGTRFDLSYGTNFIDAFLTPTSYGDLAALGGRDTPNRRAVGGALDTLRPPAGETASGDAGVVFDALYPLGVDDLQRALDQLGGVPHAQALSIARANQALFAGAIDRARDGHVGPGTGIAVQLTTGGMAATGTEGAIPVAAAEGPTVWAQATGGLGTYAGDSNAAGFDRTSGAIALGLDREWAPGLVGGIALGFARSTFDSERSLGDGSVNSYQLGAYGRFTEGPWTLDGTLAYGHHRFDVDRRVDAGDARPSADYHGNGITTAVAARYRVDVAPATAVEPFAGLRYDVTFRQGFDESGGGAFDLDVDSTTEHRVVSSLGGAVSHTLTTEGGVDLEGRLRLAWNHEIGPSASRTDASLAGAGFGISGPSLARNSGTVGLAVHGQLDERWHVNAGYDVTLASGSSAQALTAGFAYRF